MTDDPPYVVRISRLQADAGLLLSENLPQTGWEKAVLEYRKAGPVGESVLTCTYSDGRTESLEVPAALIRAMKDLRRAMASQGKGAWLSAELTVDSTAHMTCDFNYDRRPQWRVPPTDDAYIDDLRQYPRPVGQVPDWYPRKA